MFDRVIELLEAKGTLSVAFTAWAFVVWHVGMATLKELRRITKILSRFGNRITKIEGHLEQRDKFVPYRNGDSE